MVVELLFLARAAVQAVLPADACAALIPPALSARLATELPGYVIPVSSDAGDARSREIAVRGDWPCPFVAVGDFDGDGLLDRVLLVKSPQGSAKLIAVVNNNGEWRISFSEDWSLPLTESELRSMEPGLYQRSDAIDHPDAKLDQLSSIQADNSGFAAGKLNGRRAVYFLVGEHWQKLTIKDN